jgi:uracil-DNA glycosylase family 4
MTNPVPTLAQTYFRQQVELGMPPCYIKRQSEPTPAHTGKPEQPPQNKSAIEPSVAPQPASASNKRAALIDLYNSVKNCTHCTLGSLRRKQVFGAGNILAHLMIIGEAPGEEDDREGLPFVGEVGTLLTKMLTAINIDRKSDAFITNVLKCRPPGDRDPGSSEILACKTILRRQIDIMAPRAILLLGRIAAQQLLNTTESLTKLRGRELAYNSIPVVATYHPGALLRYPQYKKAAWEDLQLLQTILRKTGDHEHR